MACFLQARVFSRAGGPEQALSLLDEAVERLEDIAKKHPGKGAERMVSVCFEEKGHGPSLSGPV